MSYHPLRESITVTITGRPVGHTLMSKSEVVFRRCIRFCTSPRPCSCPWYSSCGEWCRDHPHRTSTSTYSSNRTFCRHPLQLSLQLCLTVAGGWHRNCRSRSSSGLPRSHFPTHKELSIRKWRGSARPTDPKQLLSSIVISTTSADINGDRCICSRRNQSTSTEREDTRQWLKYGLGFLDFNKWIYVSNMNITIHTWCLFWIIQYSFVWVGSK